MNKVNLHIKQMMLGYPTLFPNRLAVLRHIFTVNGNGYEWDSAGCVVPIFDDKARTEMAYDDLDQRLAEVERDEKEYVKGDPSWAQFFEARREAIASERATRERVAAKIDLYASQHVHMEDIGLKLHQIEHISPSYCILHNAPWGSVDKEWAAAGAETMRAVRDAIRTCAMKGTGSILPEYARKYGPMYGAIVAYLVVLEAEAGK